MSRSIKSGILLVFFGKFGDILLGALITPLLVRFLGEAQYGDYAFVLSIILMGGLLTSPVVSVGLRKFLAENRPLQHWGDRVYGFFTRLGIVIAGIFAVLVFLALQLNFVRELLQDGTVLYIYIAMVVLMSKQIFSISVNTLRGLKQERYSEPLFVIRKLIFGTIALVLIYYGWGVTGVLFGEIVGLLVAGLVGIYYINKYLSLNHVLKFDYKLPKHELVMFSIGNVILMSLVASLYHVDLLLLNPISGSEQTGYYKGALVLVEFLWFAPIAVQTVMVQSASELWDSGQVSEINQLSSRLTRYVLLFTSLLGIGLASLASDLVPLYLGSSFTPSILPILILIPGSIGFATARPIYSIGQAKGNYRPIIFATAGAAILNGLLNLALIPRYGMKGAATATSISYGIMFFCHLASARVIGFNPLQDLRPIRLMTTIVFSTILIFGLSELISSPYLSLLIVPPIGLVIFSVVSLLTGALDKSEITSVINSIQIN
ncbi:MULTISPECIES: polysaccharide biosynthesis C-terminal domain-containing protein [Haloferax]|uniref:oligosaccharide flippase family protein n=1 Tax=Haloferax TaxID=2251 RepID=UPI000E277F38|nr:MULTISPECIES: polysaccharide biosynthesis C-terminal domain-containing protein [Haloferax]RDZ35271.1 polysaccharide biosynthesis protein [Haloferax sp. Atlit-24N]RLM35682.1 flippase [Haloferax sp. Atlit-109R]RLM43530.1 flippase [Haloferax sp. Atlit-105R]WEL26802.1 Polysaccharide biosynthesis C-terminal domain-containing protein [Haloferax lucentense]